MDTNNFKAAAPPVVQRVATLKRGRIEDDTKTIKLERVLGVTVTSNAALDCNPTINTIAYPAGCTVVLLNTSFGEQRHIINTSRKTIASLAFSACGRYLVTGEYGHQPAVRVWDLQAVEPCGGGTQAQQVAESVHHKHGVQCVAFSNTNKYVVSIGTQHDMIVNVWDWRNNIKVASNKVSTKVKAVAFSENGNYFVTVGNRFVKFWFLEYNTLYNKETTPLLGRPAILGELRNSYFYGVACGRGECGDSTYAIIKSGLLCEFNNRRLLDKWVELRTTSANCITVGEKLIFVGCADGIVRCFDPRTLRYVTTIPRAHYLGIDISTATYFTHATTKPQGAKYPDVIAITYDSINEKLSCIYNDHSVYVWDVADVHGVGKALSHLYHSACIWGVEVAPPESHMPPGSFITCSSDDTIRVWNLDMADAGAQQSTQKRHTLSSNSTNNSTTNIVSDNYRKNIYSNELLKVVYVDKDLTFIKDANTTGNNSSTYDAYDSKHGVRSIKISADGKHLASGDRAGNIRIHDTATLTELCKIEAHDAEILCLEYTSHETSPATPRLLASASRDRFIHVFDMDKDYNLVQTLMDHSSSITAVRFMQGGGAVGGGLVGAGGASSLQMVSCCADKSLVFRSLSTQTDPPQFERYNTAIGKTTLFDMVVDASGKHVVTVCMDRNVRVYNVNSGKHTKTFKGSPADDGTLVKVVMDRSGLYLASSCTDKSVCLYDYYTSECMATMCGHSELATGLKFSNDCTRLISTSGDGCIFVWKIPHDMVVTMHARLSQQATKQGKSLSGVDYTRLGSDIEEPYTPSWAYDMRPNKVKRDDQETCDTLPNWVRRHLDADNYKPSMPRQETSRGKWGKFDMRKFIDENGGIYSGKDPDTETESMDSGTDGHKNSTTRKPPVPMRTTSQTCDSALGSLKDHESEAHHADIDSDQEQEPYYDGDAQDINSGEFTVKNIDADELRQSTRRSKWNTISNLDITERNGASAYSSPNSEDDDQASTPSGENTDRNPMSLLFASSESLDKLVNRERYLRSTFDSMNSSALSQFNTQSNASTAGLNQNSLSAQYDVASASDGGGANRNQMIINAAFATKNNPEALRKRQELAKSISDIRKALDNVGSGNSSMKNSRSTHDVSQIPEKEHSTRKLSVIVDSTPSFQPRNTASVPSNLQLCGCFMKDYAKNTSDITSLGMLHHQNIAANGPTKLSDILIKSPERSQQQLATLINPRKLKLDRTLNKYKKHKSLPVSPVSEECRLADFADTSDEFQGRRSVSYYLDLDEKRRSDADIGFRQICDDIEKFSRDFNKNYEQIEHMFEASSAQTTPTTFIEAKNDLIKANQPTKVILFDANKDQNEESSFSSDSLEDCSFKSTRNPKTKKVTPPRRCLSNNEIYNQQIEDVDYSKYLHAYDCDAPNTSESFYLNPSNKNSQDSILSDDLDEQQSKSYCNSLESILSNDSDCKSAPLEILFRGCEAPRAHYEASYSKSMPKNVTCNYVYENEGYDDSSVTVAASDIRRSQSLYSHSTPINRLKAVLRTSQTQTDIADSVVTKRTNSSQDFQNKLLKFEQCIAQNDLKSNQVQHNKSASKKGIMFFVDTNQENVLKDKINTQIKNSNVKKGCAMYIPSLETKNRQYKSKFCNVLNNKPQINFEMFESRAKTSAFTLTNFNVDKAPVKQETASLDRHLLSKSLTDCEKICHKPPKAVRRHSSKMKKCKTSYEYIRKEDFFNEKKVVNATPKKSNENLAPPTHEQCIEISYKERNLEYDLDHLNICHKDRSNCQLDSLDVVIKKSNKIDLDSLEYQPTDADHSEHSIDSLEIQSKNIWNKTEPDKKVFTTKIHTQDDHQLNYNNKIQQTLHQIKLLNEIQRKIIQINELVEIVAKSVTIGKVRALSCMFDNIANANIVPLKYRKRNLSLPNFCKHDSNVTVQVDCGYNSVAKSKGLKEADRGEVDRGKVTSLTEQKVRLNESYNSSLRRSISLSDLIIQAPVVQKRKTGTKPKPSSRHHFPPNTNLSQQQQQQQQQHIYRSRSTAALTHAASDTSDTETTGGYNSGGGGGSAAYPWGGMAVGGATTAPASTKGLSGGGRGGGAFYKRLMRPTISSQNKVKPGGAESTAVGKVGRKSGVPGKIGGAGERAGGSASGRIRHAQSELSLIRPNGSDDSSSEDNNSTIRSQLRRSKSFNMDETLSENHSDGSKPLADAIKRLDRYHQCLTATITELCAAGSSVCAQLGRLSAVSSAPPQPPSPPSPIISQPAITPPEDGNRAKLLQSIENTALALLMYGGSLLPAQTGAVVMPLVAMARDNSAPDAVVMCYYSDFLLELIEQLKG